MYKKYLLIIICLFFHIFTLANIGNQQEQITDFKYIHTITIDDNQPFYRIELPKNAYLNQFNDIRVFTQQGDILPFYIHSDTKTEQIEHTYPLQFFPLNQEQCSSLVNNSTEAKKICVVTHNTTAKQLTYLVKIANNSQSNTSINKLKLTLEATKNWQIKIKLFNFQNNSYPINPFYTTMLEHFSNKNMEVINKTIDIPEQIIDKNSVFLMTIDTEFATAVPKLTTIIAQFSQTTNLPIYMQHSASVASSNAQEVIYNIDKLFNTQDFAIIPQQENSIFPVRVFYTSAPSSPTTKKHKLLAKRQTKANNNYWQENFKIKEIYNLSKNKISKNLSLPSANIQQIKIIALTNEWDNAPPKLVSNLDKKSLVINPQGANKLLLAYGKKNSVNKALSFTAMFGNKNNNKELVNINNLPYIDISSLSTTVKDIKQNTKNNTISKQETSSYSFILYAILIVAGFLLLAIVFILRKEYKQ